MNSATTSDWTLEQGNGINFQLMTNVNTRQIENIKNRNTI